VIDQITTLSAVDVAKRIIAIISDLLLGTVENLVDLAIDVLSKLVEGIVDALDASIEIPILSALYRDISGNDLSVLDLACLVVAIPVTLIFKLVAERAPYPDDAKTSALINAKDFASIQQAYGIQPPALTERPRTALIGAQQGISDSDMKDDTLALTIAAFFASLGLAIVNTLKRGLDTGEVSTPLNVMAATLHLVYCGPDITSALQDQAKWYNIMNDVVTGVSVLKTGIDNINPIARSATFSTYVSPWMETFINVTWLAPPIGAFCDSPSGLNAINLASNLAFDAGGIIAPATLAFYWPELDPADAEGAALIFFLMAQALGGIYGTLVMGYGIANFVEHLT